MRASIPAPEADRPPLLSAALVAALALAAGLGIARWTVRPAPPAAEAPPELPVGEPSELAPEDPPAIEASEPAEPAEPPAEAPEPTVEMPEPVETPEPVEAPTPEAPTRARTPAAAEPVPPRGPSRGVLLHGRVAYLRCEGGASGAGCARDEALEAAVWAAIDTLPSCAAGPTPPGQADVVVELSDAGVEVRTRDTFADEVVRLDPAATVACLSHLASDPVLTASSRRVFLSFRFRVEP